MFAGVSDEAAAAQLHGGVSRSDVKALVAGVFIVPGLTCTARAQHHCHHLVVVRHERNANGAPDIGAESIDDYVLERQQPTISVSLSVLTVWEIRLDPKCSTRVAHSDHECAPGGVQECSDGLRDRLLEPLLDLFSRSRWL